MEIMPEVPGLIIADCLKLKQILVILIGNAIKYTREGSVKVRISLKGV